MASKLPRSFFLGDDVVSIAKELLGKVLVTNWDGIVSKGRIIETEAYSGRNDRACHANNGLRSSRTEVMYQNGGVAYVYLCYGIHHMFNVVTNLENKADAVLIRALEPIEGIQFMQARMARSNKRLTQGPGLLARAMGIRTTHTGFELLGDEIWIEEYAYTIEPLNIKATKRVGVDYAMEDAHFPWRFYLNDSDWISKR